MPRREFTKAVKVEIVRRATVAGVTRCEECGCAPKTWHIDHTSPDALQVDKTRRLTAEDGKLLCAGSRETCHGRKTAEEDVPAIAKAKRREAKHLGIPGRPTQLSGRTREQRDADRDARSKAVGAKQMPPRRGLYADVIPPEPLALPAPKRRRA